MRVIGGIAGTLSPEPPGIFRFGLAPAAPAPGLVGRREAATSCRLQGRIGARGASPQCFYPPVRPGDFELGGVQRQLLVQTLLYTGWASGGPCAPDVGVAGR